MWGVHVALSSSRSSSRSWRSPVRPRLDLPAPILLVAVGVLGVVPAVRARGALTPEIVLVGLLPPLLYSAALQTSLVDFNAHRRPILSLSIGLVVFTTVGVALVVHALLPDLGWPAAFAIGAVVAPPDAVAATAVGRRIGLPRRIVTILEGESLLNDATALVALNTAIVAATATATVAGRPGLPRRRRRRGGVGLLVFVVVGVGPPARHRAGARHVGLVVTPFIAYVVAEEIHASGVLASSSPGCCSATRRRCSRPPPSRIAERLNWRTISFLLENAVFLLIGLQTRWILEGASGERAEHRPRSSAPASRRWSRVIVLRFLWVFPARYLLVRPGPGRRAGPPWTYTALVGWAGMRGVVTLAAAFAIPEDVTAPRGAAAGRARRHRRHAPPAGADPALGGPAAEGPLARPARGRAGPGRAAAPGDAGRAGRARASSTRTTRTRSGMLRDRVEQRDFAAWERLGPSAGETPSERYARLRAGCSRPSARVLELRAPAPRARGRRGRPGDARHRGVDDRLLRGASGRSCARAERALEPRGRVRAPGQPGDPPSSGHDRRVRGLRPRGHQLGAPADVPGLRSRRLLRLVAARARRRALPRRPGTRWSLRRARRGLALVLRRRARRLSGVLPASRTPARPSAGAPTCCRPGPRR